MLKDRLLLPKFAVHESYNPPICQNGSNLREHLHTQKYPRLQYIIHDDMVRKKRSYMLVFSIQMFLHH